jgi:hypothetical protein
VCDATVTRLQMKSRTGWRCGVYDWFAVTPLQHMVAARAA